MIEKERDSNIDALKGLGIVLMIIGHVNTPIRDIIFSFHMPLFFFVSGFLYKDRSIGEILKRNFKKILIPYFTTCFFIWLVMIVFAQRWMWGISILFANGSKPVYNYVGYYVGPLWFLMCYFMSVIGFHYLIKFQSKLIQISIICTMWIGAYFYNSQFGLLPFDILNAIPATLCMLLGYNLRDENIRKVVLSPTFVMLGSCVWIICMLWGQLSMASFIYKLSILQVIGAMYGTYVVYRMLIKFNRGGV